MADRERNGTAWAVLALPLALASAALWAVREVDKLEPDVLLLTSLPGGFPASQAVGDAPRPL